MINARARAIFRVSVRFTFNAIARVRVRVRAGVRLGLVLGLVL